MPKDTFPPRPNPEMPTIKPTTGAKAAFDKIFEKLKTLPKRLRRPLERKQDS